MARATKELFDTHDAAQALGVVESRVSQLARKYGIGQIIGASRIFTPGDIQKLKAIPRVMGRPKKSA